MKGFGVGRVGTEDTESQRSNRRLIVVTGGPTALPLLDASGKRLEVSLACRGAAFRAGQVGVCSSTGRHYRLADLS